MKRLQVRLPYEENLYSGEKFLKLCNDYGVSNDLTKYRNEGFYRTYQQNRGWPNDYINDNSMTHWIIEKSQGFMKVVLYMISESIRAYAYLVLSSQASARSTIIGIQLVH